MSAPRAPRPQTIPPLGLSAEAVLDASPNPIIGVDDRGRIVYASRAVARVFGSTPDDLLGQQIEILVPPSHAEQHAVLRASYGDAPIARPMGSALELFACRIDRSEFPAEISLAPVRTRRGLVVLATIVDVTAGANVKAQLGLANEELRLHAEELEHRERELTQLAELAELLQSCRTLDEAYAVVGRIAEPLFAGDAGAIYTLEPSGKVAEAVAAWGKPPPSRTVFPPHECWALRRGQLHVVDEAEPDLRCPHVEEPIATGLLCAPLAAQSETLGLLHLQVRRRATGRVRAAALADRERLVKAAGEQIALALANIRLRSNLREQSSRDSLTGLFNRRYMEETLDREVRRAARDGYGLGLLLADIDNFKRLNDAFGHTAGDAVLREIGRYLGSAVRGEDVACRFGGEEFVVILPKAALDDTHHRADSLRDGIKQLWGPRGAYPATTMSIGVAEYPQHGTSVDQLILAADQAMYRAKTQGRDRVVIAGESEGRGIEVSAG